MANELKIGMIGLDTSHVPAFTKILNDPKHEHHVPGGKVVVGFPGGSPDFELSYSRVEGYTKELREQYGVKIVDTPEEAAEQSDVIFLESVDGRVHLQQFKQIVKFRKPVFIDKPLTVNYEEAAEIVELARKYEIPIMSCSALRYAEGLTKALEDDRNHEIIGADFFGPLELQPTQPGLFWYGIHTADMLYRTLGKGCVRVTAVTNENHDVVVGEWADGRVGCIRGNRKGNKAYGGAVHRQTGSSYVDHHANAKPYYFSLLEQIMNMFAKGKSPIDPEETVEIIRFIEAANESRNTGKAVSL